MANSVDPDQTAPIGAVCSGSMLFASILSMSVMQGKYWQQTTFSDTFFLGTFRVKTLLSESVYRCIQNLYKCYKSVVIVYCYIYYIHICVKIYILLSLGNKLYVL